MLSQTSIFTKLVSDYMGAAPVRASANDSCEQVVKWMAQTGATSALVTDTAGHPLGIVTEQDICRRITFHVDADTPVVQVMTSPVKAIAVDDYLYHGIAEMRRHQLRHMPVIDAEKRAVGILQIEDALSVAGHQMMQQIELLTHTETIAGMTKTKSAQIAVALQLLNDTVPAPEIQGLITSINNDLHRRVITTCVGQMAAEGWGQPPVAFDVIVMGSGGRGESYLYPDQDNGFILEDYADEDHAVVDPWFIELATRVSDGLNEVGFTYCNGFVMATNPLWRKSISQWCKQVSTWVAKGSGMVLRLADIFFDFVPVYGPGKFTAQLREHVALEAAKPFFLREMYKFDQEHEVALGPFNRLLRDKLDGPGKGKLNLKLTGTLPLVGGVRISALAGGIKHTSTLQRIGALHGQGKLTGDEQDYLSGAFRHITNLLLRQQLRDYERGNKVGNHVGVEDMSSRERDMLVDALRAIKTYRKRLRTELTADIF